ncbi:hypothetical protein [Paenisporosarcina sp. TG20]|uniref:hypothetical protein n=1 Tax=Paenisporosarcina sp. TG20 TaxID=1211706 RepID=UPI0002F35938|nr:hypothetical protein [Paenisporosarcina sp. TG20]
MVETTKLISIFIIIISIFGGILAFYMMSDLPKEKRKRHIEEITSQLINFVLFIWMGKIILNFPVFISDPLAILAYPSDSSAFYVAVLFSALLLFYKSQRGQINVVLFIPSFIFVFLIASFLYEFMQFVWNDNTYSFGYMILLAILLILFLTVQGRKGSNTLISALLIGWTLGIFIITTVQPFVTVFGYMMKPWFVGVFFAMSFTLLIINQRKSGYIERN